MRLVLWLVSRYGAISSLYIGHIYNSILFKQHQTDKHNHEAMKRLYLQLVWVIEQNIRTLWNCWCSAIHHKLAIIKSNRQCRRYPIRLGLDVSLAVMAAFLFSQSSLWTNRGESRVVGSLCKRLALHHWWAYGSRGCADYVFFDENTVSLFLFPLLKENFLIMCQYCACTTTIMVLNKIHQPTVGQAITKSRNRNGC